MRTKIVTLASDFGLKDPYVAEMKAAVLSICPDAILVDITHEVEKFNVRAGAFMLASAVPYFPEGTVHIAVVDPSVGSQRRPIVVETKRSFFVGPDNGLFFLAAGKQEITRSFEITSRRLMLPHVSSTFHGRDVFAPVAAHLVNGVSVEEVGPQITNVLKPPFAHVAKSRDSITGEILHVDDFGNIITNIPGKDLGAFRDTLVQVELPGHSSFMKVSNSYSDVKLHYPLILVGSHDYVEIALNQGSAASEFEAKAGAKVTFTKA